MATDQPQPLSAPQPGCVEYILDGGMGKYMQTIGLPVNTRLWSAHALIESKYHSLVLRAHREYLEAGSNVITTSNYAVIPGYLRKENKGEQIEPLTKLAVQLAQKARLQFLAAQTDQSPAIRIAGSIPPLVESYRPDLRLSEQDSIRVYRQIIGALAGVDLFLIETMGCIDEAVYALKALELEQSHAQQKKEVWIAFALRSDGLLHSGESMDEVFDRLEARFAQQNVRIVALNCCAPETVSHFFEKRGFNNKSMQIMERFDIGLGIYPNALKMAQMSEWTLQEGGAMAIRDIAPVVLQKQFVDSWLEQHDVAMLGGCCGFEPMHIRHMAEALQERRDKSGDSGNESDIDDTKSCSASPYYIVRVMAQLPLVLIQCLVFVVLIYAMAHQDSC